MKSADLQMMSVEELRRLAALRGIPDAAALDREGLLNALIAAGEVGRGVEPGRRGGHSSFDLAHKGLPTSVLPARPSDYDSETMARVYLEQGAPERAVEILRGLLAARPGDEAISALLTEAEAAAARARAGRSASHKPEAATHGPAHHEPFGILDLEELPEAYGIDEVEVLFKDPFQIFAYWEVTEAALTAARTQLGDDGEGARLVLRVFSNAAGGELAFTRDYPLDAPRGRRYFPSPRSGVRVRAATGLVADSGLFVPIAHSSLVKVPPADPAAPDPSAVQWMEVRPGERRGVGGPEPIEIVRRLGAGHPDAPRTDERTGLVFGVGAPTPEGGAGGSPGGRIGGPSSPGGAGTSGAGGPSSPGMPSSPWRPDPRGEDE